MKSIISFVLIIMFLTTIGSVYGQSVFKDYKGNLVEFQYPIEWESAMTEGLDIKGIVLEDTHIPKDNRIAFDIPNTKGAFTVLIKDSDKKNLEELLQEVIQSYSGTEDLLGIKQQILEITDTTLSNEPAKKLIVNSEESDNKQFRIINIITLHDNKEYSITYLMEAPSYDNYIPTIEKIIQSFKFTQN